MLPLRTPIRPYAWGSREAIPALLGEPVPAPQPQAELWMGAHPDDPSVLPDGSTLTDRIAADPVAALGERSVAELGPTLPFLLKLLAAAAPLSLQVHPDADRARAGCAAEDAAGLARADPRRNYRDANHKPELICALTPFRGLVGFREPAATGELLAGLAVPELAPVTDRVAAGDLRGAVAAAFDLDAGPPVAAVTSVADKPGPYPAERAVAAALAAAYPGDPGVLVALLLNLVELDPGEAVFLPAGVPHAYLDGFGVEVLANSDNVLRGGLTGKHVDVPELLAVLDPTPGPPLRVGGRLTWPQTWVYDTPAREFRLTRLGSGAVSEDPGPRILVCTGGSVTLEQDGDRQPVPPGHCVWVPAGTGPITVDGDGTVFCAGTNPDAPGVP